MAELFYFQDIGYGEAIRSCWITFFILRIALDVSGIDYKECTVKPSEWVEFKAKGLEDGTLPFGQLPLLKIDGLNLVESTSILRYLSAKWQFFVLIICRYISPNVDIKMASTIDMMVEGWKDIISGYFAHLFNDPGVLSAWIRICCRTSWIVDGECNVLLSRLEAVYKRNGVDSNVFLFLVDCLLCFWWSHGSWLHCSSCDRESNVRLSGCVASTSWSNQVHGCCNSESLCQTLPKQAKSFPCLYKQTILLVWIPDIILRDVLWIITFVIFVCCLEILRLKH